MALDLTDPVTRDIMGLPQIGEDKLIDSPFSQVAGTADVERKSGASLVDFLSWCSQKTLERYNSAEDAVKTAQTILAEAKADNDRPGTLAALGALSEAETQLSRALNLAIKSGSSRIAASAEARAIHASIMDNPELRKAWAAWVDFLSGRADIQQEFLTHCRLRGVDVGVFDA